LEGAYFGWCVVDFSNTLSLIYELDGIFKIDDSEANIRARVERLVLLKSWLKVAFFEQFLCDFEHFEINLRARWNF
jgi:hypothetical protein